MVLELHTLLAASLVFSLLLGLYLLRRDRQLARELDTLQENINELQRDMAALCTGAVGMGERLARVEQRSRRLKLRQEQLEMRDADKRPYEHAIRMVHKGAPVEEIMDVCHISRSEAELITMMHRLDEAG